MESSTLKQRQQDQPAVFSRDGAPQPITPNLGFTDRHGKPSTAPPTGSPTLAPKPGYRHRPEDDILVQPLTQSGYPDTPRANNPPVLPLLASNPSPKARTNGLNDLPIEIHDAIIDNLAGSLGSLHVANSRVITRNWSHAMRHPRRKQLSDLALVSRVWRPLIQERLYRHIKIKGTRSELQTCGDWFLSHPIFTSYVRHVEVWVPLFEISLETRPRVLLRTPSNSPSHGNHAQPCPYTSYSESVTTTTRASRTLDNATLEEIFECTTVLFPEACVLTLEGGHCKKSRKIQHFREDGTQLKASCNNGVAVFSETNSQIKAPFADVAAVKKSRSTIPKALCTHQTACEISRSTELATYRRFSPHQKISILILKGSWNIIRCAADFRNLAVALPSIREWHCVYAKPKTDAYIAMCGVLRSFPSTITKVNICLEGLNGKQPSPLNKWRKLFPQFHVCEDLGRIFPQLESLSYTGHVCRCLFSSGNARFSTAPNNSRLKSVDLFVRNVCRDTNEVDEGPSIHNWPFIGAFENLVIEAIASLANHRKVEYVRIRFLDLDSPRPLLNPYWHFDDNHATGVWSSKITAALKRARPSATSYTLDDDDFMRVGAPGWTGGRPKSLHITNYASLARTF